MAIKRLLLIQTTLYALTYSFLAYLGVSNLGIYITFMTIIYMLTITTHNPLPRRLRIINMIITISLITAFTYYAALQILKTLGVI